ncbi:hypothetical protein BD560DRAFT_486735 [Blakeslea trispora]|nr:hypothetical protein BD560DRAFT_486735 [Blakeslea trispora]
MGQSLLNLTNGSSLWSQVHEDGCCHTSCARGLFVLEVNRKTSKHIRANAAKLPLVQLCIDADGILNKMHKTIKKRKGKEATILKEFHRATAVYRQRTQLKPKFCLKHNFKGSSVGILAVKVKFPNAHSSQILRDRSKLGLELKRMSDVSECCLFVELKKHPLLQSSDDMMLIPDLVVIFMKMKLNKRIKQDKALVVSVKPTVGPSTKRAS